MLRNSASHDLSRDNHSTNDRARHELALCGSSHRKPETRRHVPRRIFGKTTAQERTVALIAQEALDGSREKTMRIASIENSTLNSVSISSAGALDMTHCDFSVKSARDEMRHIIGSSERDVIIGSDRDQNRGCRQKDKDHKKFLA